MRPIPAVQVKGAPAPEGLPPAPPTMKADQWTAQWVFQEQQKAQSAGTGSGGFADAPAPGSGPDAGVLQKTSLETYDALAICNDGSPGAGSLRYCQPMGSIARHTSQFICSLRCDGC